MRQAIAVPFGGRAVEKRLERRRAGIIRQGQLSEADEELLMIGRAVVALAVVLDDELPVRLFDHGGFEGQLGARGPMRRKKGRDRIPIARKGGGSSASDT